MLPGSNQDLNTRHGLSHVQPLSFISPGTYYYLLAKYGHEIEWHSRYKLLRRKLHLDIRRLLIIHRFSSGDEDLSNLLNNCSATRDLRGWGGVINTSAETLLTRHSSIRPHYTWRLLFKIFEGVVNDDQFICSIS